jgi:predicted nucleotidyltransferase
MARLISCSEFARRRGISVQRARELARAGRVPGAVRIGERWAVPESAAVGRRAAARGASGMRPLREPASAIEAALARRVERRRRLLQETAAKVCAALRAARVQCVPIGSFAAGSVGPDSDLDLLVLRHPTRSWAQVDRLAARAAAGSGVEVDLVFAETLAPADKARLLAAGAA